MKYSFMTFSCPDVGLEDVFSLATRLGYDGIEPRVVSKHKHGLEPDCSAETREKAKQLAAETGVAICCVATSCRYANPEDAEQQLADTLQAIDLAADLGAPRLRVFGGSIPEGVDREQAIELVTASLRSAADHAAERGVVVCMETHDAWCDPEHVADVMKRVNHPAIAVNWDIMHPVRVVGATMDHAFETLKPWIKHVHFHDGSTTTDGLKLVPIGEGDIDHRRAVELLKAAPYDDFLSGEWIGWEPYETHLPRELAIMKRYEQEAP